MSEETHSEIMRAIGRIEGKIDGILAQATATNGRVTKLEERVGTHQTFIDTAKGKLAVVSAFIGGLAGILTKFIFKD